MFLQKTEKKPHLPQFLPILNSWSTDFKLKILLLLHEILRVNMFHVGPICIHFGSK